MEERMKVLEEIQQLLNWEFEADQEDTSVWHNWTHDDLVFIWDLVSSTGSCFDRANNNMFLIRGWDKLVVLMEKYQN